MLAAESICFAYRPGRQVLHDASLAVPVGQVVALVGPNGCGKSTLLRVLAGLRRPTAGRTLLDGRPVEAWSPPQRARRLAYIAQRPGVAFGFTTRDVVRFGLIAAGRSRPRDADEALARVGLADRASEPFAHLSVGQQQRASLARALTQLGHTPGVLLADEPVSAMDPKHAVEALALLRAHADERRLGCLVVIHDLSLAARFAHRAVLLDPAGRVAASGPAEKVLSPECLAPVFGVRFARLQTAEGAPAIVPLGPPGAPEPGTVTGASVSR